jgi:hypothetical protein
MNRLYEKDLIYDPVNNPEYRRHSAQLKPRAPANDGNQVRRVG